MAIIYTYPVKADPVDADKILISDSEDDNKTKQVQVSSITSLTAGVTKVVAGTNITISPTSGIGNVTINSAFIAGNGIQIGSGTIQTDNLANGGIVYSGASNKLAIDLSASSITGTLAIGDGGTGNTATALYAVFVGTGTTAASPSTSVSTGIRVPKGTTAQQPSPTNNSGLIRYNTDSNKLEVVINGAWREITTTAP